MAGWCATTAFGRISTSAARLSSESSAAGSTAVAITGASAKPRAVTRPASLGRTTVAALEASTPDLVGVGHVRGATRRACRGVGFRADRLRALRRQKAAFELAASAAGGAASTSLVPTELTWVTGNAGAAEAGGDGKSTKVQVFATYASTRTARAFKLGTAALYALFARGTGVRCRAW